MSRATDIDLSPKLSADESAKRIAQAQHRLVELRLFTAGLTPPCEVGPALIVVMEGFDAAGKGGSIRRTAGALDPRHVSVVPIGPPTPEELAHHFLWRFWPHLPAKGGMTIFDRSWYGRILVERVEGLIDKSMVEQSTKEIVDFERALVNDGVTLVKIWLHISADEQLRRFEDRKKDPLRAWKLTADDWHNRDKRDLYLEALGDVLKKTDEPHARWNPISGEDKHYARAVVLETVIERLEADLQRRGLGLPQAHGGRSL